MNVTDNEAIQDLLDALDVPYPVTPQLNIAPGSTTDIIIESVGDRDLENAYWSYLIESKQAGGGYRPNPKYSTFNAQSRKLTQSKLWHNGFVNRRCIVPVTGFHEWKSGDCYNITPAEGGAFALAGLYQINKIDDMFVYSFTIITLPPQDAFLDIHAKSFPLSLKPEDYDVWLDPANKDINSLEYLLDYGIENPVLVSSIENPHKLNPTSPPFIIAAA